MKRRRRRRRVSPPDLSPQIFTTLMGSVLIALSVVAWKNSMLLVWDAARPNTSAPSYTTPSTSESGAVAAQATVKRCGKHSYLASSHFFIPVAMETSGAIRPRTRALLTDFAICLRWVIDKARSMSYLLQHLPGAIQRGSLRGM